MTQSQDYIFCPLCGEHNWKVDKTQFPVTIHTCSDCKKFIYTEITKTTESSIGLKIYHKELRTEEVSVDEYHIHINHQENWTEVQKDYSVILKLPKAVVFDWYRETNIKDKIKKFLVFS